MTTLIYVKNIMKLLSEIILGLKIFASSKNARYYNKIRLLLYNTNMSTVTVSFIRKKRYSRLQLILRLFFTKMIIVFPHYTILTLIELFKIPYQFVTGLLVLFTGRISQTYTDFIINLAAWDLRVNASIYDTIDGYPEFGLHGSSEYIKIHTEYSQDISRISILIRLLLNPLLYIPALIILSFYLLCLPLTLFISNVNVLFTTRYPEMFFSFHSRILLLVFNMRVYTSLVATSYPNLFESPAVTDQSEQHE